MSMSWLSNPDYTTVSSHFQAELVTWVYRTRDVQSVKVNQDQTVESPALFYHGLMGTCLPVFIFMKTMKFSGSSTPVGFVITGSHFWYYMLPSQRRFGICEKIGGLS